MLLSKAAYIKVVSSCVPLELIHDLWALTTSNFTDINRIIIEDFNVDDGRLPVKSTWVLILSIAPLFLCSSSPHFEISESAVLWPLSLSSSRFFDLCSFGSVPQRSTVYPFLSQCPCALFWSVWSVFDWALVWGRKTLTVLALSCFLLAIRRVIDNVLWAS